MVCISRLPLRIRHYFCVLFFSNIFATIFLCGTHYNNSAIILWGMLNAVDRCYRSRPTTDPGFHLDLKLKIYLIFYYYLAIIL
ncbi:hypothetical protein Y032_0162g3417 [Ancylostoma ceylanicum]|uniref:Uncharacterized protein n=1 Tax=Ancylostoma ceylanicum TaxID=53326 RepID=A0A016SXW2_9BILA|nr:hypothetical protein Y032_0162g3417 [Ancylostoma ceylanicum]